MKKRIDKKWEMVYTKKQLIIKNNLFKKFYRSIIIHFFIKIKKQNPIIKNLKSYIV